MFGASGTVGGGIYKALLQDESVAKIHVVTLERTPHIEQGVALGKVVVTDHTDYRDYAAIEDALRRVQEAYWAIGISASKVDKPTYEDIHIDFPVAFVESWLALDRRRERSFHLADRGGHRGREAGAFSAAHEPVRVDRGHAHRPEHDRDQLVRRRGRTRQRHRQRQHRAVRACLSRPPRRGFVGGLVEASGSRRVRFRRVPAAPRWAA